MTTESPAALARPPRPDYRTPLGEAALASLLSEDVGIVHRIDDGVTQWDHPRLAPVFAQLCETQPVLGVSHAARAGGMALDLPTARLSALGESVERYSAAHVPHSRLRLASRDQLGDTPVAEPDWLDRSAVHPATHWVSGQLLRSTGPSRSAWVAASRAFLADVDHDAAAMHPTSTGLACHGDPWQALNAGLLEVIERDAVMLTWLERNPAAPISSALRWRTPQGTHVRFDRAVESYRLFHLPSPSGVPVVLGVALGALGQPAAAVGAGAHLDLVQACRRALVETYQTFHWARHLTAAGLEPPRSPAECLDFDDHVAYYLRPDRLHSFDFLLESAAAPVTVDLDAVADPMVPESAARAVVAGLEPAGFDAYAVDVTSPDVRQAGLWVVRSIVPGMYPLIIGTETRPDLARLPANRPTNPEPHPFP